MGDEVAIPLGMFVAYCLARAFDAAWRVYPPDPPVQSPDPGMVRALRKAPRGLRWDR